MCKFYNNGVYHHYYHFFDNGRIRLVYYPFTSDTNEDFTIEDGNHEPLMSFYKNGNIKSICYYNFGNKGYTTTYYYPDQTISYKFSRVNGNYSGIISSYYKNGKVNKIGMASENLINGYVLEYSENGDLLSSKFYLQNKFSTYNDTVKYKSQFFVLKLIAEEENKNIDRKNDLVKNQENLRKTEEEKKQKEEELRHQQEEIKRNQLELELLAKDKAVSTLTIKAKESELLKNMLLANEKKKEIERLNQQKLIDELSIKNKENEIVKKNIEAENKQKQIHGLEKEKELSNENLKQQKFIQKLMIAGSGLLGVFLIFVFFSLAKSRKANKLIAAQKTEVEKQKEIAEKQKDIAEEQKHLLQEKQTEIIESITYAKRLQEAILPPFAFIDSNIKNNFILYKPKDIVAGDFYWAENIRDLFFIAAADSTGHGVPGAMVSVVCSNALNRSVKEFNLTETGKILDKTKELVVETFEKSTSEVKDGMDISLLCIDSKNKKVFWSGANNPLWYASSASASQSSNKTIEGGEIAMFEIKADKQPIGKTDKVNPFTTHEIEYKENTTFYLFTDGFADQFGGPNGKKFKYKPFAEILVQNVNKTPNEQSAILAEKFEAWRGELEQVDDVCIIGVKI
ncbi:MAG: SpoIIE family protein phosphatase [Bacteroidetes bacterium]|nr:SpoIIE family protein phosphatase [Bacteroidota bacterium]